MKPLALIGRAWNRTILSTNDTPMTGPAPPLVMTVTSTRLLRLARLVTCMLTAAFSSVHWTALRRVSASAGVKSL